MAELRVIKHAEGGAKNIEIFLHFSDEALKFEQGENEVMAESSADKTEYVRFNFEGEAGARARIEIRREGGIVYREEVQIESNGSSHKGDRRSFNL